MDSAHPPIHALATTVLTGFLGSGKTTLLRGRALADPGLTDTAVIVNGSWRGRDRPPHLVDFVEGGRALELPGGCLQLRAVREDLGARRCATCSTGATCCAAAAVRRIVIETSGLEADPAPILYTRSAPTRCSTPRLVIGRVVTVVDAETGAATRLPASPRRRARPAMADAMGQTLETDIGAGVGRRAGCRARRR